MSKVIRFFYWLLREDLEEEFYVRNIDKDCLEYKYYTSALKDVYQIDTEKISINISIVYKRCIISKTIRNMFFENLFDYVYEKAKNTKGLLAKVEMKIDDFYNFYEYYIRDIISSFLFKLRLKIEKIAKKYKDNKTMYAKLMFEYYFYKYLKYNITVIYDLVDEKDIDFERLEKDIINYIRTNEDENFLVNVLVRRCRDCRRNNYSYCEKYSKYDDVITDLYEKKFKNKLITSTILYKRYMQKVKKVKV